MSSYNILDKSNKTELVIKNSRFITNVITCHSQEDLRASYNNLALLHPKARHHCWAMIAKEPNNSNGYGFSDDGEPSGTAGKPIFNILSHAGVGKCAVIITRYFGGVKLGTGGLVKAYTAATKLGIEASVWKPFIATKTVLLQAPFSEESTLRHFLKQYQADILDCTYSHVVEIRVAMAEETVQAFKNFVAENLPKIDLRQQ